MWDNQLCASERSKTGKKKEGNFENASDYFLAFILQFQPPYFNSCDETGRHSLFEFSHWRVQAQYFHYLLAKPRALTETPHTFGLSWLNRR